MPPVGSFHSATTRDGANPAGSERSTMPNAVSVSTAEPGSSASTLAYRAVHRDVSWGPSSSTVSTSVGPTVRSRSATASSRARSSQMTATIVIPPPISTNCTARRGTSIDSHQRNDGCNAPPRWYWRTCVSSSDHRWCLFCR